MLHKDVMGMYLEQESVVVVVVFCSGQVVVSIQRS